MHTTKRHTPLRAGLPLFRACLLWLMPLLSVSVLGAGGAWGQTLDIDNFDGTEVSAPTPPHQWTAYNNIATSPTNPRSGVYSLVCPANTTNAILVSNSNDLGGGNVAASAHVHMSAAEAGSSAWVFARGAISGGTWGVSSPAYFVAVAKSNTAGQSVVVLQRISGGTPATLGTLLSGDMFSADGWYKITLTCDGSVISTQVQRDSDGQYLNSAGTYQAAPCSVQSVTDTVLTGAGQYGVGMSTGSGSAHYMDDFALSAAEPLPITDLTLGFIGDSITAGAGTGSGMLTAPCVYAAANLATLHGTRAVRTINSGRSASRTSDWLAGSANLTQTLTQFGSYTWANPGGKRWVYITLGVNDSNPAGPGGTLTPQQYQANLLSLTGALTAAGYTSILGYPTYVVPGGGGNTWTTAADVTLKQYEDRINSVADNLNVFVGDTNGYDYYVNHPAEKIADGIHPADGLNLGNLQAQAIYNAVYRTPGGVTALAAPSPAAVTATLNAQPTQTFTIPSGTKGLKTGQQFTVSYQGVRYTITVGVSQTVPQSIYNALHNGGYL